MAVELYLDPEAEQAVRAMWRALDEAGVPSLSPVGKPTSHRPHVSLAVFDDVSPAVVGTALTQLATEARGLPLTLAALGYFLTDESPAYLSVIPSMALLSLHHRVAVALAPIVSLGPFYRPDALLPHCTLAMHVGDRAKVLDTAARFRLPVPATAREVHLVDTLDGSTAVRLDRS